MPLSTFRWETMALAVGGPLDFAGGTLPSTPGGLWTSTYDAVNLQGLLLHIAWLPPGNITIPIECTGVTGAAGGLFGVVTDANGENEVAAIDAGGAIASLPFGHVAPPGSTVRPVWAHPGGPLTFRLTTIAAAPGAATGQAFPAEMDLPGDATVPPHTAREWDSVAGTTTSPPAYTPPSSLGAWITSEGDGTTLRLTATGLLAGEYVAAQVRTSAGAVTMRVVSPGNFRPTLISAGGAVPSMSGDGVLTVGTNLVVPVVRMVADGDAVLVLEIEDGLVGVERVVTFSPGLLPTDDPTPPEGLSPCLPVEVEQCCEGCDEAEPDVWAAAVEAAWTKLHDLIGDPTLWEWRRCLRVWRPCPEPCGCRSYCDRCSARRVVTVPQFDVRPADVAGLIDGADINTALHWTTRRDATSSELTLLGDETLGLPSIQNMDAPTGNPATWGVLLWIGRTPPAVREAVGAIACDILAACAGPSTRPPANATSITEGAVTIRIDPSTPAVQAVRDALAMTTVPAFEFAAPWDTSRGAGRWEEPTQLQIAAAVNALAVTP